MFWITKVTKIGKWKCNFMKISGKVYSRSTHDAKIKTWRSVQRLNAVPAKNGHAQYSQEAHLNFRSRSTRRTSSNLKVPIRGHSRKLKIGVGGQPVVSAMKLSLFFYCIHGQVNFDCFILRSKVGKMKSNSSPQVLWERSLLLRIQTRI